MQRKDYTVYRHQLTDIEGQIGANDSSREIFLEFKGKLFGRTLKMEIFENSIFLFSVTKSHYQPTTK